MKNDVKIHPASEDQPCHWCKAGFVFVADRVNGTSNTTLCEPHADEFFATFGKPEKVDSPGDHDNCRHRIGCDCRACYHTYRSA